jgi:hypothetical protein
MDELIHEQAGQVLWRPMSPPLFGVCRPLSPQLRQARLGIATRLEDHGGGYCGQGQQDGGTNRQGDKEHPHTVAMGSRDGRAQAGQEHQDHAYESQERAGLTLEASARASCQAAIARACSRKVFSAAALYLDSLSGAWAGCRLVRQGHIIGPQGIRHPRQRLSLSRTIPGRAGAVGVALATDTSGHQGPTRLVELGLDHIVQPQSRISLLSAVPFNLGMPRTPL